MSKKIILSTGNNNKVKEIKELLKNFDYELVSKKDLNIDIEVEEDEPTLEGNAIKKAKEIWEKTGNIVIADDTGLFVEALNGEPGIKSARYSGKDSNDKENRRKLLQRLEGRENREGRFITIIAIVFPDGRVDTIKGECLGSIAKCESGAYGFGYDSIFVPEGYIETFAELGSEVKQKISHRAKALEKLKIILENI